MRILFFDTETNGLPKSEWAAISDLSNWPRVLQIAWQIWEIAADGSSALVEKFSAILRPDPDLVWNEESETFHKISRKRAEETGVPGAEVFPQFRAAVESSHIIVAHNIGFDKPVVLAECLRVQKNTDYSWWKQIEYCSCYETTAICKIPSKYPKPGRLYKPPKLIELYQFLYGAEAHFDFHNAEADTECLVQCFQELVRRRLVPLDAWTRRLRVLRLL